MKAVAMEDVTFVLPIFHEYCPSPRFVIIEGSLNTLSPTVTKRKFLFTIDLYLFKHSSDEKKGSDHQG